MRSDQIEIPVLVKQAMPTLDTKGRDDQIDGRNCDTATAEKPVIFRCLYGEHIIQNSFSPKLPKDALQFRRVTIIARTAQHFEHNIVAENNVAQISD